MDALPLDAHGYAGTYKLVGGRPSLDFVNTISWAGTDRAHDWLTSPANVRAWLASVGGAVADIGESELTDLHEVRRGLTEVLRPLGHGRRPTRRSIARFNRLLAGALARRRIDPDELTWTWLERKRAVHVLDPVILDAADVVTGPHDRLRHCPSCDWLFEDQTRNGRRRWCDMADCGSRAKARSYYQRTRER